MRTGTVSVNCSVYTAGQTMTEPEKSSDLGEISAVISESDSCRQTVQCAFSFFCVVSQKPKVKNQHGAR